MTNDKSGYTYHHVRGAHFLLIFDPYWIKYSIDSLCFRNAWHAFESKHLAPLSRL